MSTNNSTRVKAPAKNILPQRTQGLDLPEHNDASTLKPIGKGMVLLQQGDQHPGPQLDGLLLTDPMEGADC